MALTTAGRNVIAAQIVGETTTDWNNANSYVGVGDSANDLPMLMVVDKPFFLSKTVDRKAVWKEIEWIARAH